MAISITSGYTWANGSTVTPSRLNSTVSSMVISLATDKLLGRVSSGTGAVEEVTCTDFAQSLLDDSTAANARTTLGLGTGDSPTFTGINLSGVANLNGTTTVGVGGTGTGAAVLRLDGGSASSGGPYILLRRNSVDMAFIGTESVIIGNNSDALAFHAGANDIKWWAGGEGNIMSLTASGLAVTGNITATTSGSIAAVILTDTGASGANLKFVGNGGTTPNKTIRAFNGSLEVVNNAYSAAILGLTDAGNLGLAGTINTTAGVAWDLGSANAVSPTAPNRTLTVVVAGTTYYLHAKTTND